MKPVAFYYLIEIRHVVEPHYHKELNLVNAMSKIYIQVARVKGLLFMTCNNNDIMSIICHHRLTILLSYLLYELPLWYEKSS